MPWVQTIGGSKPGTIGSVPDKCDLCKRTLNKHPGTVYDARTKQGPWGWLCPECFNIYGVGLGIGKGQQYCWIEQAKQEKSDMVSNVNN